MGDPFRPISLIVTKGFQVTCSIHGLQLCQRTLRTLEGRFTVAQEILNDAIVD